MSKIEITEIDLSIDVGTDIKQDLSAIFNQQRDCYVLQPNTDYKARINELKTVYQIIKDNTGEICKAINTDFGNRPDTETKVLEIFPVLEAIKFSIRNLKSWMKPKKHRTSKWFWPSKCYVSPQPLGVIGIISPWNYPLFLSILPLVAALAAGNRVMMKLSEHTPNISQLLKRLLEQKFSSSKLAVILGESEVAKEFSQLPFDHLFFTGSTATGMNVAKAAAENLTPVTLELGGKSPCVLVEDEIREDYVDRIWLGKLLNSGQTCIAPDYIWLPRGQGEILWQHSKKSLHKRFDKLSSNDYCSIINKQNYDRILKLVDDAVNHGAIFKSVVSDWHSCDNGVYKIAPVLLLNVNHSMEIMQQEIFGPVLPVMEYDTIDELQQILRVTPRPLALYLLSNKKQIQQLFTNNTISGALNINSTVVHAAQESLPFGGVGDSGMGAYRGKYGFTTFSRMKPIYKQSRLEIFTKFYPPVKKWQNFLLNLMLK